MTRLLKLLLLLGIPLSAVAQFTTPVAAYISPSPGVWAAWSSAAGFGQLGFTPEPVALYCQASAGAPWTPCVPGGGGGGSGTVTSVSVVTANGVSGTVATATTTPAITLTLGAITPTTVNGAAITSAGSSTQFLNGTGAYSTPAGSGTVTNVATTSPITGGPITTTGTIACATCVTSAAALTLNQIMLGGGLQASSALGSLGTTTTVLHGNAAGAPSFGAVVLSTDVSGNLPNANLATQTANTVLGALTATTPSGLAVPSCSTATSALIWTSGTGFGCNTITPGTGTVTSVGFTGGIISVANPTTTPAFTVAGTSGGIPYFSAAATWASSAALTANVLIKGGGAGAAPSNSSITDNTTTVTTTDTGGYVAPVFVANGTTAGFMDFPQGTTSAAVAPCNTATSICMQAPTSVTSYLVNLPGAAASGFVTWTNVSNVVTESVTALGTGVATALGNATNASGGIQTASQGTISSGPALFGSSAINTVVAQTIAVQAGHFTNLVMTSSLGGTCTTAPTFNVFDGTTNTGTAKISTSTTQTKGTSTNQTQTLTFAAGDLIGVYISTAGGTCTTDTWTVEAQYSTP